MSDWQDFQIDIHRAGSRRFMRVTHLPTGRTAERDDIRSVLEARDECVAEIRALIGGDLNP